MNSIPQFIYSKEIQQAQKEQKPIVALESTIITHGMPYPENKETAQLLEEVVRNEGACPATIAIVNGVIRIGLDEDALETISKHSIQDHNRSTISTENNGNSNILGSSSNKMSNISAPTTGKEVLKVSTKDIAYAIVRKANGGTTVAATMYLASLAGIRIFATGGIGGVHRGAETSFDISADLEELARTPVAVVCAGAKSILDLQLTLEYLETKSVPVIGYQTGVFPAFYTRNSKFPLDISLGSVDEIAQLLHTKWKLETSISSAAYSTTMRNGGVVIANPIAEEYSLEESFMQQIVDEALVECKKRNIVGKETTPFLLSYIANKTDKQSLQSNIALVKNNAILAAQISVAYNTI